MKAIMDLKPGCSKATVSAVLNATLEVVREGQGVKRDPYTYWVKPDK